MNENEMNKILGQDENVLWQGVPRFWPFFFGNTIVTTIFGLMWLSIMVVFLITIIMAPGPLNPIIFVMPHFWVGLALLVLPPIYNWLVFKRTAYAITNRRVIIQKGVIGRDFEFIDFDKISQANVNVGVFDKLFKQNTGSILVSTPNSFAFTGHGVIANPNKLCNITNPYEVYRYFEKVSYDVKTDVEYPNQLRPSTNPGFQTSYTPDTQSPTDIEQDTPNTPDSSAKTL